MSGLHLCVGGEGRRAVPGRQPSHQAACVRIRPVAALATWNASLWRLKSWASVSRHVLYEMEAIRHLGGLRCPSPCAVCRGFRAIPRDHLHAGVRLEPLRTRARPRGSRSEGDGLAALQVHEDGAIGVAFPQRPVINTQHAGRRGRQLGTQRHPRRGVCRLIRMVQAWPRRTPALHPQRAAERHQALASRSMLRAQGAAMVGSRSVQMRRRQARLPQNRLRLPGAGGARDTPHPADPQITAA